jgi:hypothetical protein
MLDGYERGAGERGTGSHYRRRQCVEGHFQEEKLTMFFQAAGSIMAQLRQEVGNELEVMLAGQFSELFEDIRRAYSCLWEKRSAHSTTLALQLLPLWETALNNVKRLNEQQRVGPLSSSSSSGNR